MLFKGVNLSCKNRTRARVWSRTYFKRRYLFCSLMGIVTPMVITFYPQDAFAAAQFCPVELQTVAEQFHNGSPESLLAEILEYFGCWPGPAAPPDKVVNSESQIATVINQLAEAAYADGYASEVPSKVDQPTLSAAPGP